MTDRIAMRGIRVYANHGVLPRERERGQTFLIDLHLEVDLNESGASDRLEDTVDYGALAAAVHDRVATERWNLIERVAERIAELVLEERRVTAVEVTVHKPEAPVRVPFRDIAVTIRRSRPAGE